MMKDAKTSMAAVVLFAAICSMFPIPALAYNPVTQCGSNAKCRIVDVLDRDIFNNTHYSNWRVSQAWDQLRMAGCKDVADVVVGGTFGENGAPDKSVPAGFAEHLMDRCTLVVHYELEGPVIDAQAYEDSVEHGRKALAIVLNKLDTLRAAVGNTDRLRVWGHSKGAAIVESTWRMEARNGQTKFITRLYGKDFYVNACPSNNCYYFGFGYSYEMEHTNRFSISRATSSMWDSETDGYIEKPAPEHKQWWRLTTFTNLSDPIYECSWSCAWDLIFNSYCHRYENFLRTEGYEKFDKWNSYTSNSGWPSPQWRGNQCGE